LILKRYEMKNIISVLYAKNCGWDKAKIQPMFLGI
jgi:hypothetical protein